MDKSIIEDLYQKDEKLRELVPKKILNWAMETMEKNFEKANDENQKEKVYFKIIHTKEVVEAGWDIIKKENEVKLDLKTGTILCLLHDIARFEQSLSGTYIDIQSGMDHASVGTKMFLEQNFDIENKEEIAEAIYWHSRKENEGKSEYCKFIRDADKTALLRYLDRMQEIDTEMYKIKIDSEVSPEILERFLDKKQADTREYKTIADWFMFVIIWSWDLNLKATKEIWKEEKFFEIILEKMRKLGVKEEILGKIEEKLKEF